MNDYFLMHTEGACATAAILAAAVAPTYAQALGFDDAAQAPMAALAGTPDAVRGRVRCHAVAC